MALPIWKAAANPVESHPELTLLRVITATMVAESPSTKIPIANPDIVAPFAFTKTLVAIWVMIVKLASRISPQ